MRIFAPLNKSCVVCKELKLCGHRIELFDVGNLHRKLYRLRGCGSLGSADIEIQYCYSLEWRHGYDQSGGQGLGTTSRHFV
jgi:hypothetical protein